MEKLQNNFTTHEQSKRLLELGLPANSADCYIHISECVKYNFNEKHEEIYKKYEYGVIGGSGIFGSEIPALLHLSDGSPEYLPCWSAGRLIELIRFCTEGIDIYLYDSERPNMVMCLVKCIEENISNFDFSKLED